LTYPSPDVSIFRGYSSKDQTAQPQGVISAEPGKNGPEQEPAYFKNAQGGVFPFLNLRKTKNRKRDQVKVPKPRRKQK
jgi:hypothetical protein